MNVSRRDFFNIFGLGAAAAALPGCITAPTCSRKQAKIALQLYSIRKLIGGEKDKDGKVILEGIGLDKTLENLAAIGYKGVEFAGYYQYAEDPKGLRNALLNAGIKVCGTHINTPVLGLDTKTWTYDVETLKKTCDFNMTYGNNLLVCPGGGNMPTDVSWSSGRDGARTTMTKPQEEYTKRICEFYNKIAADAAKCGCRVGIHNHMWEHGILFADGTSYWDYFFTHTDTSVCMEQDVGWSTCAGIDPKEQYVKYPHRSPTLHAKENGMGAKVTTFDAILGKPGEPGATPVDWDGLIPVTEQDGVAWYVVECERHFEDLSAVLPSYNFLKMKGLK